jgi:very-short-patch-repair endonuclease
LCTAAGASPPQKHRVGDYRRMHLETAVTRLGGLAATHELYRAGATRWMLSHAARTGRLIRVRQGWYCLPDTPEALVRAARVGGRLSCIAGAKHHGLDVRGIPPLHICVGPHDSRLRSERQKAVRLRDDPAPGTVVHWVHSTPGGTRFAESVIACLVAMARCQSPERVVAAADSAIRMGVLSRRAWLSAIRVLPPRLAALLSEADGVAESITESVALFRLRRLGLQLRQQVPVPGVGDVDFLLGQRLVIEVDGRRYHVDRFEEDRRRDARLSIRGFRVLRFSYRQVFERWGEVKAAILAATARGDHH